MDLVTSAQARLRDRRLAGDARAGSWARAKAQRRQWAFARSNGRRIAVFGVGAAVFIAALAALMPAGFMRGFAVGVCGTAAVSTVLVFILLATGVGAARMGATAEQWTASELRPLRRHGWRLVNHFGLGSGDIDHLLVGPAGLVVVETKWSAYGWHTAASHRTALDAVAQVKRSARQVELWAPIRKAGLPVQAAVFLWGSGDGVVEQPLPQEIDGVRLIHGVPAAKAWRHSVHSFNAGVTADQIDAATANVVRHLHNRDTREEAQHSKPPSLDVVFSTFVGCVLAALAGVLVVLEPLSWGHPWIACAVVAAAGAIGLVGRRYKSSRLVADAWLAGAGGIGVIAACVYALA